MGSESEALKVYRCLADEYKEADRLVKEIGNLTADVSRCLTTEPFRLTISGMGIDNPLRPGFPGEQLICAPEQWPSAQELGEAVDRLYKAQKDLSQAYDKLSAEEKKQVTPPPKVPEI